MTTFLRALAALPLGALLFSCAGVQSATPISIESLRTNPTPAQMGFTNANGVPSLADRMQDREGLKLAIFQVAYSVEGRPEMTFKDNVRGVIPGMRTWDTVTTTELVVPASLALASSAHLTSAIETALVDEGFSVVPHTDIAATEAYAKYYREYPYGYNLENGWTVVGSPPMRVKEANSLFAFGTLDRVWPDKEALQEIEAELGKDVLCLCVRVQVNTMNGRSSNLAMSMSVGVSDPDYVGYGIGGFGHMVTQIDGLTEREGATVPGFIEPLDGGRMKVQWTALFSDLERVHTSLAQGLAAELRNMAYPRSE